MDVIGHVEAIFRAAHECDTERVAAMLDDDPDLLSSTWHDQTVMIWPICHGRERDVDVARLLLERGAEVDALGFLGRTALHYAAIAGRVEVLSLLLQNGADSRRADNEGCTALMLAAEAREVEIVRLLLENMGGRGLDVRDEEGRTALWLACHFGNLEMVSALLLAGADHTIPDKSRRTPKGIAEVVEHEQCVAMIQV
jgi:ankyrin repeat protein